MEDFPGTEQQSEQSLPRLMQNENNCNETSENMSFSGFFNVASILKNGLSGALNQICEGTGKPHNGNRVWLLSHVGLAHSAFFVS